MSGSFGVSFRNGTIVHTMSGLDLTKDASAARAELARLAAELERAEPSVRVRRRVAIPANLAETLRWFWETFGQGELTRHAIAPDDAIAQVSARMTLVEWCERDPRYGELVAQVELDHEIIAATTDEVVVVARRSSRHPTDPTPLFVRAPSQSAEAPDFERREESALRFLTASLVERLWSDKVRVILAVPTPFPFERPFPVLAPEVGVAAIEGVRVWVKDTTVHGRPGCAIYFDPGEAERIDDWICRAGLADHALV